MAQLQWAGLWNEMARAMYVLFIFTKKVPKIDSFTSFMCKVRGDVYPK